MLVALIVLAAASIVVLADKNLYYNCADLHHHNNDRDSRHKIGGVISDAFAEKIVKNMGDWSEHKYNAKYSPWLKKAVHVGCDEKTMGTEKPAEEIAEQERIVGEHRDE